MKKMFCISLVLSISLVTQGQNLDSVQFKKLFSELREVYIKNIDPYLIELTKSENLPLSENANIEAKQIHIAGIETKFRVYQSYVDAFFTESYNKLSKDLSKVGAYPKAFLTGYFDQGIQRKFPNINPDFFSKTREETNKVSGQK